MANLTKFGRSFTLTVQAETGQTIVIKNPFTVDFMVSRANYASLGTATFRIRNLALRTRNQIYKDAFATWIFQPIEFHAGYGTSQSLIFKGYVKEASSYRQEGSVDMITQIDCYMGAVATQNNVISASINGPVSQLQVIDALIGSLSPLGAGYVSPSFDAVYPRGRSLIGNSWKLLQNETGSRCFIDNGRIYCMKEGDVLPTDIYVISAATGLLGAPRKSKAFVVAEILFEPQLSIGQRVELISDVNPYLNNIYTITGIEHYGTISDAIGGKARTRVSMYIGANALFPALGEVVASLVK